MYGITRAPPRAYATNTIGVMAVDTVGTFVGLLDTYPNASLAYSFRKLRTAYAGSAVRIRRSSDNAEADIGFDASGDFDTAAAAAHIGGGSGFIKTWYDQSGNGLDISQATAGLQPQYTSAGLSSLPTITFLSNFGSGSPLQRASVPNTSICGSSFTLMMALEISADASQEVFNWEDSGSNRLLMFVELGGSYRLDYGNAGGGNILTTGTTGTGLCLFEGFRDTGGTAHIVKNGTDLNSALFTGDLTSANGLLSIGTHAGGFPLTSDMSELVLWGTDLGNTNRPNARINIKNYWSLY